MFKLEVVDVIFIMSIIIIIITTTTYVACYRYYKPKFLTFVGFS
jgi:hypothetical protein